jgi:hypothetical protein
VRPQQQNFSLNGNFLSRVLAQEWAVLLCTAALLLVLSEAGFRFGLRLHAAHDEARKKQIGGIQGAVLVLVGLLLGFTMAMAVNRYDLRRDLVVKQANAISTTFLRASLLPNAHQAPVRDALRRYVDVKLKYPPFADNPAKPAEGTRLSADLEAELWKHATAAANEAPTNITGTFIVSLNEMIDTEAERIAAGRARIPDGVWLLVIVVAGFGCFTTSYNAGAQGARTKLASVFLPLLLTVVIVLIFDLAHPRQGLIRTSQQPLIDLQQSIQPVEP